MTEESFASLGRIAAISKLYEKSPFVPFSKASFHPQAERKTTLVSKLFLEGIDFNLVYFPFKHLGYKCIVALASEMYAGLSKPQVLSVNIGVSAKLDFPQIRELWDGICSAAVEHGFQSAILDLVPSKNGLTIGVSACGESKLDPAQAASKDLICLSGNLAGAYLGLQLLERERKKFEMREGGINGKVVEKVLEQHKMMVASYLKPEVASNILDRLCESSVVPSFSYVVDKGLADTLRRLHRDSGWGVKVYASKIPFEGNSVSLCKELNIDPISAAMNGGEDYKLLFVIPLTKFDIFRKDFQDFEVIGHLARKNVGTVLVTPDDAEFPITAQGWGD